jgi:uncharacterized membrane protein YbhN (UPF0104 family)
VNYRPFWDIVMPPTAATTEKRIAQLPDTNEQTAVLQAVARRAVVLTILALALGAVVLEVPDLGGVRQDLEGISAWWIVLGLALEVGSCASFVVVFRGFFDEVSPRLARRIAWIETASGALLPGGGVTSYVLGGVLLHRGGMDRRRIVVRSGGLFWFTSAVNAAAACFGAVLLVGGVGAGPQGFLIAALPALIIAPLAIVIAASPRVIGRDTLGGRLAPLIDGVSDAWRAALHPSWRLLGAVGYLGFDIGVLFCVFHGLGYDVGAGALILGYLVGYCAAMVPIPGGIGVLDGGLAGALVLYGIPAPRAAAAVLVYHAIAFWVPSLGGAGAYAALLRHRANGKETLDALSDELAASDSPARSAECGGRTRHAPPLRLRDGSPRHDIGLEPGGERAGDVAVGAVEA